MNITKSCLRLATTGVLGLALYGCGNMGEQVEVRIEPDIYYNEWTGDVQDRTHVIVTSLADNPVEIQNISVNRGACRNRVVAGTERLSQYGSYTKFLLPDCGVTMVKEVELSIDGQSYTYQF